MLKALRSGEAAMPFIMLTVLIDMIAIGLIIPVLPALVGSFAGSQSEQAFWYGVVAFSFGLSNFLASPMLGALSDHFGRRPMLLLGFLGLGLSFFVTALSTTIWGLIAVRIVSGAMQANAAIANAYVADITPPEQRAKRFGLIGAMMGVGFIVGPVMGGLLGAIKLQLPFLVAGGLAIVNLLYGYFVLPESLSPEQRKPFRWRAANPANSLRALAQLKGIGSLVGVVGFSTLAQFILYTTWVLYTTFKFGWGPSENGWSMAIVGIVSVVSQAFLLGRLLKRYTPQTLTVIGLLSSVIANILWGGGYRGLDDVCRRRRQHPEQHRVGVSAKPDLVGCRQSKPRANAGRRELAQQPDGRCRASAGRTAAGYGVASATWRLAHRRAVLLLRRASGGLAIAGVSAFPASPESAAGRERGLTSVSGDFSSGPRRSPG